MSRKLLFAIFLFAITLISATPVETDFNFLTNKALTGSFISNCPSNQGGSDPLHISETGSFVKTIFYEANEKGLVTHSFCFSNNSNEEE